MKEFVKVLIDQFFGSSKRETKRVNIFFYMRKNPNIPGSSILWIETKNSKRWFSEAKLYQEFRCTKRVTYFSREELENILEKVRVDDIEITIINEEISIRTTDCHKFIFRIIQSIEDFLDEKEHEKYLKDKEKQYQKYIRQMHGPRRNNSRGYKGVF